MPAPFVPVVVPFSDGQRDDLSTLAGEPSALLAAQNVVFTRKGAVRGRPGAVTHAAESVTLWDTTGPARTTTLAAPGYNVSGPCRRTAGASDELLLALHGRLLERGTASWRDCGPFWSVKRTTRAATLAADLGSAGLVLQALVGANTAGRSMNNPSGLVAYPVYAPEGTDIIGQSTTPSNGGNAAVACVTTPTFEGIVYNTAGGFLRIHCGPLGSTAWVESLLANDAAATTGDGQNLWAVSDPSGVVYVAYATTTVGQIKVLKVTLAGAGAATVASSVSYGFPDPVLSVALDVNATRGCLLFTGGDHVRSRVFLTSTMVDQAINVDIVQTGGNNHAKGGCVGIVTNTAGATTAWLAWHNDDNGNLDLASRSLTAATGSIYRTIFGRASGGTPDLQVQWRTLFPARSVQNRPVMGATQDPGSSPLATWLALDVGLGSADRYVSVVAAGSSEGCNRPAYPGTAVVATDGALVFGVWEGVTFNVKGVDLAQFVPVRLAPLPPPATNANGLTLMGGCQSYYFDGLRSFEAGYPGSSPAIAAVKSAGTGLTASGSYTLQVVWTFVDAVGNYHRSPASLTATVAVDPTTNLRISWAVTVPQATSKGYAVYAEVYSTAVNPGANAPLYLINRQSIPTGAAVLTGVMATEPFATARQLYTEGNVVNDERPPAGDRGVAFVQDRVWVASESAVYATKVIRQGIAPAWYTGGFLTVRIPSSIGAVTAIAPMDDKLVVIGSSGTAVLAGAGYDDLGNGPGFSPVQLVHPEGSAAGSRAVATCPQGVAWLSTDGLVRLLARGLNASIISRPSQVGTVSTPEADVVFVPPGQNLGLDSITDQMLIIGDIATGQVRVLDLETGQWAIWVPDSGFRPDRWTAVGGVAWSTADSGLALVDYSSGDGKDVGTPFTAAIVTRPLRLSQQGAGHGWGRVRRMRLLSDFFVNHTLAVELLGDEVGAVLASKFINVTSAVNAKWPYSTHDVEVFATTQRAATVSVSLQATPGLVQWDQIELWVSGTPESAPSRSRS